MLKRFEAKLYVEAEQVTFNGNELGSGIITIEVSGGRLKLDPARIKIPGGGFMVALDYFPTEQDISLALEAAIEKFDISIPIRKKKPESDMGGFVTLDAAIRSTAPDMKSLMVNADGHIDFALVPENFSAGIIDLWAVNLISAIFTKVS